MINVVGLKKPDGQKYCVCFDDATSSAVEALRSLGRWASNPELTFTWYDAAILSRKIRAIKCDSSGFTAATPVAGNQVGAHKRY